MWPFKRKQGDELNHWFASAESFNYSPQTFYDQLQQALAERKVPDLTIERIEFAEGGILSDQRTYLRIMRERLVFDVCAAPFGTGYFFSCRTVRLPVVVHAWQIFLVLLVLGVLCGCFFRLLGLGLGTVASVTFFLALILTFRNAATLNAKSPEAVISRIPVLGTLYEAWFKVETYFRFDTRCMYLDLVPNLVRELCNSVTSAMGVRLVRQYERAPILGELYKPVQPRESGKP